MKFFCDSRTNRNPSEWLKIELTLHNSVVADIGSKQEAGNWVLMWRIWKIKWSCDMSRCWSDSHSSSWSFEHETPRNVPQSRNHSGNWVQQPEISTHFKPHCQLGNPWTISGFYSTIICFKHSEIWSFSWCFRSIVTSILPWLQGTRTNDPFL